MNNGVVYRLLKTADNSEFHQNGNCIVLILDPTASIRLELGTPEAIRRLMELMERGAIARAW
jgi:hypothetical protein